MTLLDDVRTGRCPLGQIPDAVSGIVIQADLAVGPGQGEVGFQHQLGGFRGTLCGELPHLVLCDPGVRGADSLPGDADAQGTETLPAQPVQEREIIALRDMHPLR